MGLTKSCQDNLFASAAHRNLTEAHSQKTVLTSSIQVRLSWRAQDRNVRRVATTLTLVWCEVAILVWTHYFVMVGWGY